MIVLNWWCGCAYYPEPNLTFPMRDVYMRKKRQNKEQTQKNRRKTNNNTTHKKQKQYVELCFEIPHDMLLTDEFLLISKILVFFSSKM